MQKGDEAEHGSHTAPLIRGEAVLDRDARDLAYNVVHEKALSGLDANRLQEAKINREFTGKRVEISAWQGALGLKCRNLE